MELREMLDIFRFVSWLKVVVFTGGPCGGKSTFLKMAITLLQKHGIKVVVVPEVARELISAGFIPWDPLWKSSLSFQQHVFTSILQKEAGYFEMIEDMNLNGQKVVFLCDRGLVDGMAYAEEKSFKEMLEKFAISLSDILDRYDGVIHLVTAAEGAEEYYVTDEVRVESAEQARELDQKTLHAWMQHLHVCIIDNSTSFDLKIVRALQALGRIIAMPIPQEIERKFRVDNFSLDQIPEGSKSYEIAQTYLERLDKPGIECRVRVKVTDGQPSFYYTEKTSTEIEGVRGEFEEQITEIRYNELLSLYGKLEWNSVKKTRYKFKFGPYIWELDVYNDNLAGLVILEVELPNVEAMQTLEKPSFFSLVDVTNNPAYSNRSLAAIGLPDAA